MVSLKNKCEPYKFPYFCVLFFTNQENHAIFTPQKLSSIWYYSSSIPELENPSCLHTTAASAVPKPLLHTDPHTPSTQTSTRPCRGLPNPVSLISPVAQSAACAAKDRSKWHIQLEFELNILAQGLAIVLA